MKAIPNQSTGTFSPVKMYPARWHDHQLQVQDNDKWYTVDPEGFTLTQDMHFPRGFRSWMETFYTVTEQLTLRHRDGTLGELMTAIIKLDGKQAMIDFAEGVTDTFEERNQEQKDQQTIIQYLDRLLK